MVFLSTGVNTGKSAIIRLIIMPISEQSENENLPSTEVIKSSEIAQVEQKNVTPEQVMGEVVEMTKSVRESVISESPSNVPEVAEVVKATDSAIDLKESGVREQVKNVVNLDEVRSVRSQARESLRLSESATEASGAESGVEVEPESGVRRTLRESFQPEGDLGADFDEQLSKTLENVQAKQEVRQAEIVQKTQEAQKAEARNWQDLDTQIEKVFDAKAGEASQKEKTKRQKEAGQKNAEKLLERPSVSGVKSKLKEGDILGAVEMSDLIDSDYGRSLAYRDVAYALIDKGDLGSAKEMVTRISDERSRFGLEQQLAQLERNKKMQMAAKESKGAIDTSETDKGWDAKVVEPPENLPTATGTLELPVLKQTQTLKIEPQVNETRPTGTLKIEEQTVGRNETLKIADQVSKKTETLKIPTQESMPSGTVRIASQETGPKGTLKMASVETGPTGTMRIVEQETGPTGTVRITEAETGPTGTLRIEKVDLSDFEIAEKELVGKRDKIKDLQFFEWGSEYEGGVITKEEWSNLVDNEQRRFQGLQYEAAEYEVQLFGLHEKLRLTEAAMHKDRLAGKEPSKELVEKKQNILQQIRDIESMSIANENEVRKLKIEALKRMPKTPDVAVFAAGAAVAAGAEAYRHAPERVDAQQEQQKEQQYNQQTQQYEQVYGSQQPDQQFVQQPVQNINTMPNSTVSKKKNYVGAVGGRGTTGGMAAVGWVGNKFLGTAKGVVKVITALPNYLFKADLGSGLVEMFNAGQKKLMDWMDQKYKKPDSK